MIALKIPSALVFALFFANIFLDQDWIFALAIGIAIGSSFSYIIASRYMSKARREREKRYNRASRYRETGNEIIFDDD